MRALAPPQHDDGRLLARPRDRAAALDPAVTSARASADGDP